MQRFCVQCQAVFEITDADLAFYDKVSPVFGGKKYQIPPPTHCPACRRQRKLAWRNERTLYQRICDLCTRSIVSVHAPDNPHPVYCNPCWWGDGWDSLSFGQSYDPHRSFFDQYAELYRRVPQRAMVNDDGVTSENCAYCFDVAFAKNCYLCFGMWKMQDCYYCRICDQSRFCVDCEGVKLGSEFVYESVDSQHLYGCAFLQNSENCKDCFFGFDLKGCSDCIGCVALRQKRFHIFNEPYSEDEYRRHFKAYKLSSRSELAALRQQFEEFSRRFPRKNMNIQNCEDCTGDHLFHCRDVQESYVCTNMEHCRWIERSDGPKCCYDIVQSGNPQWCYECITNDDAHLNCFSLYCNQSHDILYGDNCLSCASLLGCISLRRKKYCILNKQYEKGEFEALAASIIKAMQRSGEFGEFFPVTLSPYGYNETNAQEFFPLMQEDLLQKGWHFRENLPFTTGRETIAPDRLPDAFEDIPPSITQEVLACASCLRNYKIIPQELEFYHKFSLPVPDRCPDCRNLDRLARRNPQKLWNRTCAKCGPPGRPGQPDKSVLAGRTGKGIQTTYPPERPEKVYCEDCYLKEVY